MAVASIYCRNLLLAAVLFCAAHAVAQTPLLANVAYGNDPDQRFDVYAPPGVQRAPVILLVHGGAWAFGDKAAGRVVDNKVAHWLPLGFAIVAVNYPDLQGRSCQHRFVRGRALSSRGPRLGAALQRTLAVARAGEVHPGP